MQELPSPLVQVTLERKRWKEYKVSHEWEQRQVLDAGAVPAVWSTLPWAYGFNNIFVLWKPEPAQHNK